MQGIRSNSHFYSLWIFSFQCATCYCNLRNKIKLQLINTLDKVIDIKQFSLFGKKETRCYYFCDISYSIPQRLNKHEADDVWVIIQDNAFSYLENCEQLYLITQISDGIKDNKFVFEIKSPDYSAEEWDIVYRRKYVSSISNEDILKSIINDNKIVIKEIHEAKSKFYHEHIIVDDNAYYNNEEDFTNEKGSKEDFNGMEFSIVDSEIGLDIVDSESMWDDKSLSVLIEVKNNSDEECLITYNKFILLDKNNVIIKYEGYYRDMEPTDTPIYANCKDRFKIAFKAKKCTDKSGSFTLKFNVTMVEREETIQVEFHTDKFNGKWYCVGRQLIPPKAMLKETAVEKREKLIKENSMPEIECFEQSFGIEFKKLNFTKNCSDCLQIYGFVKGINRGCIFVALNSKGKILSMETLYSHHINNTWKPFELSFSDRFQNVNKVEIYTE